MTNEDEANKRFKANSAEMTAESDRGCILIGASLLDDALSNLLRSRLAPDAHVRKHAMEPLFAAMGPLSSFSSRINMAYCLELLQRWEFEDLELIRKIRNKAAHEYTAKSFKSPEIIQFADRLQGADQTEVGKAGQSALETVETLSKFRSPPDVPSGHVASLLSAKRFAFKYPFRILSVDS